VLDLKKLKKMLIKKYNSNITILSIFLFRTGTGKSTLLNEIISLNKTRKINMVNVKPKDMLMYKKLRVKIKHLEFEQLKSPTDNSLVLIEDIIELNNKEEIILRTCLNYNAHHHTQKVIFVSHQIQKTSMHQMMSFFNYIIFTSALANEPIIRTALNYFKIDKLQLDTWMDKFRKLGMGKMGTYFYYNCDKMSFNMSVGTDFLTLKLLGIVGNDDQTSADVEIIRKKMQLKFDKFLAGHKNKAQASAVFSIIINCIDVKCVREHDLTFSFRSKTKGSTKISLIDYVTTLLTSNATVSQHLKVLHKYILNYCYIPKIFMINKNF
jgi:hypothetical protein